MITKVQATQLKGAITHLVNAAVNDSWSGAGDPADVPIFAAELETAKLRVDAMITKLTAAPGANHG